MKSLDLKYNHQAETCLKDLIKYLDLNQVIFVGGLVINHYRLENNQPLRQLGDLDVIQQSDQTVNPQLIQDFKITHYHQPPNDFSHYWSLKHRKTDFKVDIFPTRDWPELIQKVKFTDNLLKIKSIEEQFIGLMDSSLKVLSSQEIKPVHLDDLDTLANLVDWQLSNVLWQNYKLKQKYQADLKQALSQIKEKIQQSPNLLNPHLYQDKNLTACPECLINSKFPLD